MMVRALAGLALALAPAVAAGQTLDLPGSAPAPAPQCMTVEGGKTVVTGCTDPAARALAAQHAANVARGQPGITTPEHQLGLFNEAATKEQFGNQFGKSTVPQAVPPPPSAQTSPFFRPH